MQKHMITFSPFQTLELNEPTAEDRPVTVSSQRAMCAPDCERQQ